jgi:hypothetical protein
MNKLSKKANNKFQTLNSGINKLVQPKNLTKASIVLNKTGNILSKVGNVSGKILKNPLVGSIVAANPELLPVYGGLVAASAGASKLGRVSNQVSNALEKAQGGSSVTVV